MFWISVSIKIEVLIPADLNSEITSFRKCNGSRGIKTPMGNM